MSVRSLVGRREVYGALACLAVVGLALQASAGGRFFNGGAVGGVKIDAEGVVKNATVEEFGALVKARKEMFEPLPGDLNQPAELRKISLRRLQETIAERRAKNESPAIPFEMEYLAGMTRVQYVFVYPEEKDIVIVGPAEPLAVNDTGFVVGANSGRPALQLDHLLLALRTAEAAANGPISCSIDPTPEGIQRLKQYLDQQKTFTANTPQQIEEVVGLQTVTINNVSPTSDFARIMVAADYRMKRIAMGLDASGVKGLPSYMEMMQGGSIGLANATPRWWMAPNYDALWRDQDGLAWELRGAGVQVMTEDSLVAEEGGAKRTGKASPVAQKWADGMTKHFEELCDKHSVFGEMRNIMDLSVVAALLLKEDLPSKAGLDLSLLMNESALSFEADFPAPKKVSTEAAVVKKGRKYIVSAQGGVEINSWEVASKTEMNGDLVPIREKAAHVGARWWWN